MQCLGFRFQSILPALIQFGMKNLPKNLCPLFCGSHKQLHKVALRDHGDLGILLLCNPQQLCDIIRHISITGDYYSRCIQTKKLCICLLPGHFIATLGRSFVFRIAGHLPSLILINKNKLHKGRGFRLRVLTSEHTAFFVFPTGFSIKSKNDSIKNSSLTCTGISGDQEQTLLFKFLKINFHHIGIGAKRRYHQFFRFHTSPPCICFKMLCAKSLCASVIF